MFATSQQLFWQQNLTRYSSYLEFSTLISFQYFWRYARFKQIKCTSNKIFQKVLLKEKKKRPRNWSQLEPIYQIILQILVGFKLLIPQQLAKYEYIIRNIYNIIHNINMQTLVGCVIKSCFLFFWQLKLKGDRQTDRQTDGQDASSVTENFPVMTPRL